MPNRRVLFGLALHFRLGLRRATSSRTDVDAAVIVPAIIVFIKKTREEERSTARKRKGEKRGRKRVVAFDEIADFSIGGLLAWQPRFRIHASNLPKGVNRSASHTMALLSLLCERWEVRAQVVKWSRPMPG